MPLFLKEKLYDYQKRDSGDAEYAGDQTVDEVYRQGKIKKAADNICYYQKYETGSGVNEYLEYQLHWCRKYFYHHYH